LEEFAQGCADTEGCITRRTLLSRLPDISESVDVSDESGDEGSKSSRERLAILQDECGVKLLWTGLSSMYALAA
jgi:hypothetical protein